ncbi:alpha-1,2-fucosyltransferase [Candidatus Thiosymbion oneisti]|uniref:alpha-1,2-fucosyltransferase n=1 Tax=Candidatus Thiosymbion oneisti TaxID=589554 RepID=UPI000AEE6C03|nr:alpha-1,2-fucosyltransferase [Candidatus Thiosymbion oneisti]
MTIPISIFAYLNGGLGNQLFQYATARAMAYRHNAELVLDNWSGFVRDRQYRRHYELAPLPVRARIARPWQRLPIWLYRWQYRHRRQPPELVNRHRYGDFLQETEISFLPVLLQVQPVRSTWLVGYWQSPRYFDDCATLLRSELMPPPPNQRRFLTLGDEMQRTNSVALGIRLYEESADPAVHAREGRVKTAADIRATVERLRLRQPQARFYIFCAHRSPLLDQLNLPDDTVSVTHDDGFTGTLERLWLMTRCRHHIITNSSYYWWGAWLSAAVRGSESQQILAADNFVNSDSLCPQWETF